MSHVSRRRRDGAVQSSDGTIDEQVAIAVTLIGSMPGLEQAQADDLMQQAHQVCPYSKATRGNVEVKLESKV